MDQRGEDRIQDVIQVFADVLRQKAQDEIVVLLKQSILPPIPPVSLGVRQMLSPVQLDHDGSDGVALATIRRAGCPALPQAGRPPLR